MPSETYLPGRIRQGLAMRPNVDDAFRQANRRARGGYSKTGTSNEPRRGRKARRTRRS